MTQDANKVQDTPVGQDTLPALFDKKTVCEKLGFSARTLENMVRDGQFPPAVRIGKFVYWSEAAIRKWQRMLFSAQEAWQP